MSIVTVFRKFLGLKSYTERQNDNYNNSTPAGKRIIIVRDALAQLTSGLFKAGGGYMFLKFSTNKPDYHALYGDFGNQQLNSFIKEKGGVTCVGCAKGSLFIADVMRNNHCTIKEAASGDIASSDIQERFRGIFEDDQLNLGEAFYENAVVVQSSKVDMYDAVLRRDLRTFHSTAAEALRIELDSDGDVYVSSERDEVSHLKLQWILESMLANGGTLDADRLLAEAKNKAEALAKAA